MITPRQSSEFASVCSKKQSSFGGKVGPPRSSGRCTELKGLNDRYRYAACMATRFGEVFTSKSARLFQKSA